MGIRPNQPRPRLVAAPPRCRHTNPSVPVEVHDRLDGRPEVVAWLCPDCYELTRPPLPSGAARTALPGLTAESAAQSLRRSLAAHRYY